MLILSLMRFLIYLKQAAEQAVSLPDDTHVTVTVIVLMWALIPHHTNSIPNGVDIIANDE